MIKDQKSPIYLSAEQMKALCDSPETLPLVISMVVISPFLIARGLIVAVALLAGKAHSLITHRKPTPEAKVIDAKTEVKRQLREMGLITRIGTPTPGAFRRSQIDPVAYPYWVSVSTIRGNIPVASTDGERFDLTKQEAQAAVKRLSKEGQIVTGYTGIAMEPRYDLVDKIDVEQRAADGSSTLVRSLERKPAMDEKFVEQRHRSAARVTPQTTKGATAPTRRGRVHVPSLE